LAGYFVGREFEREVTRVWTVGEAEGGAVVDDPISASGEKGCLIRGGANCQYAGTGGLTGTRARGGVFDDDAILCGEVEGGRTFGVGLGIGLAVLNVGGGDEMMDVVPKAGGTEADFGEDACGGSDDGELSGSCGGEKLFGAGEGDHVGNVFDFGPLHPGVFSEMRGGIGVWEEVADGSEAGTAVGELDGGVGIEVVFAGPASPNAGHSGSRVDQNAIHVDEETSAGDLDHGDILAGNGGGVGSLEVVVGG
jgi:hypothetical protein